MSHIEFSQDDPDITITKIYVPDDPSIQVHQSRVQHCPPSLPLEFYWYGTKRSKAGRPSKKILKQLIPLVTEKEILSTTTVPAEAHIINFARTMIIPLRHTLKTPWNMIYHLRMCDLSSVCKYHTA